METMGHKEWHDLGVKLYGTNTKDWKYKCVSCGNEQTGHDFDGLDLDWKTVVFFSCLGRWKKGIVCDWTLGGLFKIHKREVVSEGKKVPVFLFADEHVLPKPQILDTQPPSA